MSNKKKEVTILLFFLFFVSVNAAYADEVGCCSNLGAGLLTCSADRLALRDKECCPKPELNFPGYYKSQQNPDGPANSNDCSTLFFFSNKACSSIEACALGCCCSELGGEIKPEAQCKATGLTFHKGQTNCNQVCPVPQCNDGLDNDNNGCADFEGGDLGCTSPADNAESGGSCVQEGVGCTNPSYIPKLSNLEIMPVKGQKKFLLKWKDECNENSISYEILRCKESSCTNFAIIGITNTNSFGDASGDLLFDTTYTYQVKARYNLQTANPTITKTASLGSIECMEQLNSNNFCIHESYYNKYKNYLSTNFPNEFKDFAAGVKNKFGDKLNKAFFCDTSNKLMPEGTSCPSSQICAVSNNKPSCLSKLSCNYNAANPFGLYYTLEDCETDRYCFYDRSYSTVDSCFGCDTSMACYDYKTEDSCTRDNCKVGNCKWKSLANPIGIGACVGTSEYNCQWCEKKGTSVLENLRAFNEVFDFCTKDKSNLLSEGNFKCYFKSEKSKNCEDVVCKDYGADQCSNAQIVHDENNRIKNPSLDECGIKVCQSINNICVKNADGDNKADCTTAACENDYFAPNTTLLQMKKKGAVDSLIMQIYDRTSVNSSVILKTSSDYATFLCVEPCGAGGHPYNVFTKSRKIIISNLNAFDGDNGTKLLSLNEGVNVIRYYSQDPARNIGEVKKIAIEAHSSSSGPKVFSINISGSSNILGVIYTNNNQPTIDVHFFEPAIITFARLVNKKTGSIFSFATGTELNKDFNLKVSEALTDGNYTFELNAKNENGKFMDSPFSASIVIDTSAPTVNITPSNGETINKSPALITLKFSEEARLDSATINSEDIKSSFSTTNNKVFTATLNLLDGNKNLEIFARDFANNQVTGSVSFIVDANPAIIKLVNPRFGTASKPIFDVIVETDNDAVCRYALDDNFEFEFMDAFTITSSTTHTISNFNKIQSGDVSTHKLNVRCKDSRGITFNSFDINVDTTPPLLKGAFAFPNPIIEKPSTTTLTIEADEPVVCKYSATAKDFDNMENKFDGYDDNNFKIINNQLITVENETSYLYFAACKNKAELKSDAKEIPFKVDLTIPISIISHTPEFFNSTNVVLAVETNKKSQCKLSESDSTAQNGEIFGAPGYSHTRQLISTLGRHTFYVVCKDQFLEKFSDIAAVSFTVDTTPPIMSYVNDTSTFELFPGKTCLKDRLRVKYLGKDNESNVKEYFYSIIRKIDNKPILDFVQIFIGGEWLWVGNLSLDDNIQYLFSVKAKNFVGLVSRPETSDGITVDTSVCKPQPFCGDGNLDSGELCDPDDGTDVFGQVINDCTDYTTFIGGSLGCRRSTCMPDTTNCIRQPFCGDKIIQKGEHCDDGLLGTADSCTDLGFASGALSCDRKCFLDTSKCIPKPKCGNGFVDAGEECDGSNLGPLNGQCTSYSTLFTGGTLRCSSACKLDTTSCSGVPSPPGACGDNAINIGEACDGSTLGSIMQCTDYNEFVEGAITCSKCKLNTSSCVPRQRCGNRIIDIGEECDGSNLGILTSSCLDYSKYFSGGLLRCNDKCELDTFGCSEAELCGNNFIDGGEQCDNSNFSTFSNRCTNYSKSFLSGNLSCVSCKISTSGCVAKEVCGNGVIDEREQCDGNNFDGISKSCASYSHSFQSGNLKCDSSCLLSTADCIEKPTCGNGNIDNGESCDGTAGLGDTLCKSYSSNFKDGNLKCTSCQIDTSNCKGLQGICGDNIINEGEACDSSAFGQIDECTDYQEFSGGLLKCNPTICQLDTSSCVEKGCGNHYIDTGEECDGRIFGSIKKCDDIINVYSGGVLSCTRACSLDISGCIKINKAVCGDGDIDIGEQCDDSGPVFGAIDSCLDFSNFIGGNIGCNGCNLDTTSCIRQPFCGDKIIQKGEHCDDGLLGTADSCTDLGFAGGILTCDKKCFLDTSKCIPKPKCGNGFVDAGEECDGSNLGPLNGQCTNYSTLFTGGTLRCSSACKLDTSSCAGTTGTCGDSLLNIVEVCDGSLFGSIDQCTDYAEFTDGILTCAKCQLNTISCVPKQKCGNGVIDQGEECDSTNFGILSTSCAAYTSFFTGGTLTCDSDCKLDTFGCQEAPKCGNGFLDAGETCDGINFGNVTDLSCSRYSPSFVNGSISCSSCQISTRNCETNITTPIITCRDRGDCKLGNECSDNSDCESRFCINNKCTQPTCNDGIKNQDELGIDCGGSCKKCQNNQVCSNNNDCESGFCSFGFCKPQESCSDSRLSPGESDVDCGGHCPIKCADGKSCSVNEDCGEGLQCFSSLCKTCEDNDKNCNGIPDEQEAGVKGIKDTDNDGLPDEWEIQNDLNPNDPNDADLDSDKDGLTNLEEFDVQKIYGKSTNPNLGDTDGDGFTDKEEIDKNTNPVNPEDFPKSNLAKILMILFGILVLISGFGYLAYKVIVKKREEQFALPQQKELQRIMPQQQLKQIQQKPKEDEKLRGVLKKKEEQKAKEREKLFEAFGKEEKEKPKIEEKEVKKEFVEIKAKKKQKIRYKKPKEDVFIKLKEIAKETKKPKAKRKNVAK